jgi:hypothetical protein
MQKIIAKIFYSNISHIISVNSDSKFSFTPNDKISVIPAFIPPTPDETEINQLPEFFHKIRHKHKFLITANAFRISSYKNQDLYGIDLSIELMKRLIDNGYKDIGFIYVIPDIGDYDYFEKMQNLVKKYNLEDNFHFFACDLCKRPEGAILFKNRNIEDLFIKTTDVINNYEEHRAKIENIEFEDNAEKILEVYKRVLTKK